MPEQLIYERLETAFSEFENISWQILFHDKAFCVAFVMNGKEYITSIVSTSPSKIDESVSMMQSQIEAIRSKHNG